MRLGCALPTSLEGRVVDRRERNVDCQVLNLTRRSVLEGEGGFREEKIWETKFFLSLLQDQQLRVAPQLYLAEEARERNQFFFLLERGALPVRIRQFEQLVALQ